MRFHVLGVPHTIATPEYSGCAFTQKTLKLARMLKMRGHWVAFYGHHDSVVEADELVGVTSNDDLHASYPGWDWRTQGFPKYRLDDWAYRSFYHNAIAAIEWHKRPGDFLLVTFGANHKPVVEAHRDLIVVESGIGYPDGGFARFRIFESYAVMHAYQGVERIKWAGDGHWYDAVIGNAVDPDDFEFSRVKDDYFLFLGRVGAGKGVHIAMQIVEAIGGRLVIAGAGALHGSETRTSRPIEEYVELVGLVGPEKRKRLLSRAKALLAPSTFLEPFCTAQVEAMMSGTPVISSDWGAFCVPLDAEVLTKRGWLKFSEVRVGQDETLGFDEGADCTAWTPITAVNVFANQQTVEYRNRSWTIRATPQHRWSALKAREIARGKYEFSNTIATIDSLRNSWDRIRLAAAACDGLLDVTPQEAAIIGWLLCDGSIETRMRGLKRERFDPTKHGGDLVGKAKIWQSKLAGIEAIRSALAGISFIEKSRSAPENWKARWVFVVDLSVVRAAFVRAQINDLGYDRFILGLSLEARRAFLQACVDAEGCTVGKGCVQIAQNEGPFSDAIALCAYLCGYRPLVTTNGVMKGVRNVVITLGRQFVSSFNLRKRSALGPVEDVWCPTTRLGTWTMRWNGQIMLTGNSEINVDGVTGFRCRTFGEFCQAARNVGTIDPHLCRERAERFTLERVADEYDRYFRSVAAVYGGAGWYEPNSLADELIELLVV